PHVTEQYGDDPHRVGEGYENLLADPVVRVVEFASASFGCGVQPAGADDGEQHFDAPYRVEQAFAVVVSRLDGLAGSEDRVAAEPFGEMLVEQGGCGFFVIVAVVDEDKCHEGLLPAPDTQTPGLGLSGSFVAARGSWNRSHFSEDFSQRGRKPESFPLPHPTDNRKRPKNPLFRLFFPA